MNKYLLSIVIPSYNRPRQLENTLSIILPQVLSHSNVQLKILDNCSPVPAKDILLKVLKGACLPEQISVMRHKFNIGGNGNILRTFEEADGEYLWCLGDDDKPAANAVEIILGDISNYDFVYAYYRVFDNIPDVRDCANGRFLGNSIGDWVGRIKNYGCRLFISEAIFKLDAVRPYMQAGYMASNAGCPHVMLAYQAVIHGGNYLLAADQIAKYQFPGLENRGNFMSLIYGSLALLSLNREENRRNDYHLFFRDSILYWFSPYLMLRHTIALYDHFPASEVRWAFSFVVKMLKPSLFKDARLWMRWSICQIFSYAPAMYARLIDARYSQYKDKK